ncbi:MAG TPA: sugar phosphate isomerase/epimerase [Rhizomicrobium sp.]|nr:sugar phosphate isomerase/epimerase [Rhizomicrobium sp.]
MSTRRDVMRGGAALLAASALPASAAPAQKSALGTSQTALGRILRDLRAKNGGKLDPVQLVDRVHELGGGGVQFTVPLDADLKALRARLDKNNMFLQGDLDLLSRATKDLAGFEQALKNYKALGADCVRVVTFVGRRYETFDSLQAYKDWQVTAFASLDACLPIAERVGMPLAMENHKDRAVDEEVEVLRKYSSQHLGATVDFGNNIAMCDDPMDVIVKLSPYAKSVHMKNMAVQNYADGFLLSEVLFEDGFMDIPAMWAVLKKANPALKPVHELITRNPLKVPVLTDKYWVTWPDRGGKFLADTIRMVNANQSKKPLPMIDSLPPDEQLKAVEDNNRRCFEWAKTALV